MTSDSVYDVAVEILMFPALLAERLTKNRLPRLLGVLLYLPWAGLLMLPVGLPLMALTLALTLWENTAD